MKKSKQFDKSQPQVKKLAVEELSLIKEVDYIIDRSRNQDSRVVALGSLILFSTTTGDAWILDMNDDLALNLAKDGERLSFSITETRESFNIGWTAKFQINKNEFVVVEASGKIRTVFGYPTQEILNVMRQVKKRMSI